MVAPAAGDDLRANRLINHNGSMAADEQSDPYLWLEDITGEDALAWVRRRNEPTLAELCGEEFERMRAEALEVLDTDARIPYVRRRGEHLYNFWRDAANPRGLWRRTTLDSYRSAAPAWDVLIDVDELARADDENWVWAGADVIEPDHTVALISLSRGGSDAAIVREFDMRTRQFVTNGFELPEAKTQIAWEDENTVLLGTDFGEGSLTDSGYPRLVKRWKRGQRLEDAETLFSAANTDVIVAASVDRTPGFERTMLRRAIDFFNDEVYELRGDEFIRIDAPTDATVSVHRDWLLIELRTDWFTRHRRYTSRLAAGRRIRRIPRRHGRTAGGLRARRAHLPAPLRLDAGQADRRHAGRRRQPGRDRHPRNLAGRTGSRHPGQHQHRDRRHRRPRR